MNEDMARSENECALISTSQQITPGANEIEWPCLADIRKAQEQAEHQPDEAPTDLNGIVRQNGGIWIPNGNLELKLKRIIFAHCGSAGHRGADATTSILSEQFIWTNLESDVLEFVQG